MPNRILPTLPALALATALLTGCRTTDPTVSTTGHHPAPAPTTTEPRPAPAWESTDMDGNIVRSTDFAGKVVLLDFWATWCAPCIEEIPGFIQLQEQYGPEGLVIIGADIGEEPAVVKAAIKQLGINYLVIASTPQLEESLGGVEDIPTTFIIDRQGRIAEQHAGFTPQHIFEAAIKPLLTPGA